VGEVLTERETEVLRLVAQGQINREVSDRLAISALQKGHGEATDAEPGEATPTTFIVGALPHLS
jgi:hypothetical protein